MFIHRSVNNSVKDSIEKWVNNNVFTFAVARVDNVNDYSTDRMVDVQPLTLYEDTDGTLVEIALIQKCPVILQGTSLGHQSFPIAVNDTVLIGFPKDSIEEFTFGNSTDTYTPVDRLKWGSAQAVVLGFIARAGGVDRDVSPDNFEIKFQDSEISITPENVITISNPTVKGVIGDNQYTITTGGTSVEVNGDTINITSSGNTTVNGCVITPSGNVITANGTDLDAFKAQYDAHGHATVPALGAKAPPS